MAGELMEKLLWRIRCAYWFKRYSSQPIKFCWDSACAFDDQYLDEDPREAAVAEMSYWYGD